MAGRRPAKRDFDEHSIDRGVALSYSSRYASYSLTLFFFTHTLYFCIV
nr:MAG TPA: hypothetical protein [Caudoviricetes sp.]